jgi:ABC-2 type transport system permease protein
MNKTFLIFKHEFLHTIRRTGFVILTLAVPFLALLGIGILHFVSGITGPPAEVTQIGYVDESGGFDQLASQDNFNFVRFETQQAATQALIDEDIPQYFIIQPDFIATGTISLYSTHRELQPPQATSEAIQKFLIGNLLTGKVAANVITRVETSLIVVPVTLTSTGDLAPIQGGYANFIVPGIFSLLLALSLVFSSIYILQGLSEEKENRLMEILLSSVSTRQLLTGKVLGFGAAGLVQVMVWVISLPILLYLASSSIGGFLSNIHVPISFWILGIVYFILGYGVFAVLSATVAAITSSLQEAQSLSGIYTLFNFVPFWFLSLLMFFPANPVWVVFTIFPFSAPVLTMVRLGLTGVPAWQLAVSIIVLILSIMGGLWLAARLLRTYMLMYGKRPNLGEIIRTLRTT